MAQQSTSTGVGITTVLFVVFLVLKFTHNISWSWWWVTSPLWIPLAIVVAAFAVTLLVLLLAVPFKKGNK